MEVEVNASVDSRRALNFKRGRIRKPFSIWRLGCFVINGHLTIFLREKPTQQQLSTHFTFDFLPNSFQFVAMEREEIGTEMSTVQEEGEEDYRWREVKLPSLIPIVPEPQLEKDSGDGDRKRGNDILIAVDHGPHSKHAFDWALVHLCKPSDTIHLVYAVSDRDDEIVYRATELLMENLAVEAFEVAMVKTMAWIGEGFAGKVICKEAERLKPAAVVMGTRHRGWVQSVLQGSVSEYCFHHCKIAPIIVVPGKEVGEQSVI